MWSYKAVMSVIHSWPVPRLAMVWLPSLFLALFAKLEHSSFLLWEQWNSFRGTSAVDHYWRSCRSRRKRTAIYLNQFLKDIKGGKVCASNLTVLCPNFVLEWPTAYVVTAYRCSNTWICSNCVCTVQCSIFCDRRTHRQTDAQTDWDGVLALRRRLAK